MNYEHVYDDIYENMTKNYEYLMTCLLDGKNEKCTSHKDKFSRLPVDYAIRSWNAVGLSYFVKVKYSNF